jgi:hypothetical protein
MRSIVLTAFALLPFVTIPSVASAQDARAIQFAEDAAVAMEADFDSMRKLNEKGAANAADLRNCKLELLDAQLLLVRLRKDNDAVTDKLQQAVEIHEQQLAESRALVERGASTDHEFSVAKRHVLKAQLRLAKHVHDDTAVDAIVRAAVELEQQSLERITRLANRGLASQKDIALQKMRLAVLIGDKTIETD